MLQSACSCENLINNNIEYLTVFPKQSRGSVCVKLFYVNFHGAAVAIKVLPTDVASECLDACVLKQVSLQTVRRRKPATAYLTVIGIETLVHRHVPSEACPVGESLSTITTMMSQISQSRQLVLIHPPLAYDDTAWNASRLRLGIYRLRLGIYRLRLGIFRHLLGTLNISSQSTPSTWKI